MTIQAGGSSRDDQSNQRMLSLAQRAAGVGVFEWEFQSGRIRSTPELEDLFGVGKGEFPMGYREWLIYVHPEDLPIVESMLTEWQNPTGTPQPWEFRIVRSNGEIRWIEACCEVWTDERGEIKGIVGSQLDITERKLIAQALHSERLFLRKVIDGVPASIMVKDSQGRFLLANESAAHILGISTEEIVGKTESDCRISFEQHLLPEEHDSAIALGCETMQTEISLHRLNGQSRDFSIAKGPLVNEDGSCDKVLVVASDISDRKRAEREKTQLEAQAQRAHRLESIGTLAGGIAHDFNNLLAGLFGYLELARSYVDIGSMNNVSSTIGKALSVFDRAKDLTRQLLTFAKGGAPTARIEDISKPINDAVAFALSGSNIAAHSRMPSGLWPCKIDKNQIAQALDNILINAKEAMPEGGTISITADNYSDRQSLPKALPEGNYVKISIADQGKGISADVLEHVFDPFFTTKETGHGLGLSIAYSIAKRHGGTIEIDSILNQGTTVTLFLPALPDASLPKEAEEASPLRAVKGRVLLMDDEQMVQDVVGTMLGGLGYSTKVARDGDEAIDLYRAALKNAEPFDAVILDLTVRAGMGGMETLKRLLEIDPQVQAIVSSGYSNDPVMSSPKEHGFRAALSKPFQSQELDDLLRKLMAEAPVSWLKAV